MGKRPLFYLLILALGGFTLSGCTTEFEVNAPAKEIRAVYGILDPADSVQYIRISTAFQVDGDALAYAAERDLSLSGLSVRLSSPDGTVWEAEEVTGPEKEDGIFIPNQFVYKFRTDGSSPEFGELQEGVRYRLDVGTADAPDYLTAETVIPPAPQIKGQTNIIPGAGQSQCLPRLFLDRDLNVFWSRVDDPSINFEVRVYLNYQRNGVPQTLQWGPTELFNTNKRCVEGSGNICYQFEEKFLLRFFSNSFPADGSIYTYETSDSCVIGQANIDQLPRSLGFEVTAVDQFLSNYMTVNDPRSIDLSVSRPEYTNVSGNIDAVGVFGSINRSTRWAIMRECGEAILGLNGTPLPLDCNLD